MDYQEAIKYFEFKIDKYKRIALQRNRFDQSIDNSGLEEEIEFLKTAISAMQEIQAIHDNGISLERLKDIDFRKQVVEHINYMDYMDIKDELEEYKKLGTLEEVQESMDKQNPEKPAEVYGIFGYIEYECRECGNTVNYMDEYCKHCGKKQDWEVLEL